MKMCFTGYRTSKMPFLPNDTEKADRLKEGIKHFLEISSGRVDYCYCGMCDGADLWAAMAVIETRERLGIKLCCVVPFENHIDYVPAKYRDDYRYVLNRTDDKVVLGGAIVSGRCDEAFAQRNKYMVDNSEIVTAICDFRNIRSGGTFNTIKMAKEKNKYLFYLNPITCEITFAGVSKEKYEQ